MNSEVLVLATSVGLFAIGSAGALLHRHPVAMLMAVEHASAERKGLYDAFPQMGAPAGTAVPVISAVSACFLPGGWTRDRT